MSTTNPPYPCPTKVYHSDTYASISPEQPSLSAHGKTVLITGGGTGIGRATVQAFAAAGARKIIMLGGRRSRHLEDTRALVVKQWPKCYVDWYNIDITDLCSVQDVVERIGERDPGWRWDVLVLNSGFLPRSGGILGLEFEGVGGGEGEGIAEWWKAFELNVKGNFLVVHALLPRKSDRACVVGNAARAVSTTDPTAMSGHSAYISSKMALVKFLETLAAEHPELFVASFHPGSGGFLRFYRRDSSRHAEYFTVHTDILRRETKIGQRIPLDTPELASHFTVWLCSPEARFLRGRFVWANWDVDELKAMAGRFQDDPFFLTSNIIGWPFGQHAVASQDHGAVTAYNEQEFGVARETRVDSVGGTEGQSMPGAYESD